MTTCFITASREWFFCALKLVHLLFCFHQLMTFCLFFSRWFACCFYRRLSRRLTSSDFETFCPATSCTAISAVKKICQHLWFLFIFEYLTRWAVVWNVESFGKIKIVVLDVIRCLKMMFCSPPYRPSAAGMPLPLFDNGFDIVNGRRNEDWYRAFRCDSGYLDSWFSWRFRDLMFCHPGWSWRLKIGESVWWA